MALSALTSDQGKGGEHEVYKWGMECWHCHSARPQLSQCGGRQRYLKTHGRSVTESMGTEMGGWVSRRGEWKMTVVSAVWKPWIVTEPTCSSAQGVRSWVWGPRTSVFWGGETWMDNVFEHGIWDWVFWDTSAGDDKVHGGSPKWSRPYRKVS